MRGKLVQLIIQFPFLSFFAPAEDDQEPADDDPPEVGSVSFEQDVYSLLVKSVES